MFDFIGNLVAVGDKVIFLDGPPKRNLSLSIGTIIDIYEAKVGVTAKISIGDNVVNRPLYKVFRVPFTHNDFVLLKINDFRPLNDAHSGRCISYQYQPKSLPMMPNKFVYDKLSNPLMLNDLCIYKVYKKFLSIGWVTQTNTNLTYIKPKLTLKPHDILRTENEKQQIIHTIHPSDVIKLPLEKI